MKYSHPSPIENQLHPLQKSKDNFLTDKCRVLAWNPTTNIEDLPAIKLKKSHDQDMLDSRQLDIVIDISKENPCEVQTPNKGYLQNTHVSDHTNKTKQDELSFSHPPLNICTIIETEFNIETSDNIVTGSLESKRILQSCSDSDPKAATKNSISYESCLRGCELSNITELNEIYDNKASFHGVGYVKQNDNIF